MDEVESAKSISFNEFVEPNSLKHHKTCSVFQWEFLGYERQNWTDMVYFMQRRSNSISKIFIETVIPNLGECFALAAAFGRNNCQVFLGGQRWHWRRH